MNWKITEAKRHQNQRIGKQNSRQGLSFQTSNIHSRQTTARQSAAPTPARQALVPSLLLSSSRRHCRHRCRRRPIPPYIPFHPFSVLPSHLLLLFFFHGERRRTCRHRPTTAVWSTARCWLVGRPRLGHSQQQSAAIAQHPSSPPALTTHTLAGWLAGWVGLPADAGLQPTISQPPASHSLPFQILPPATTVQVRANLCPFLLLFFAVLSPTYLHQQPNTYWKKTCYYKIAFYSRRRTSATNFFSYYLLF
jgi:hypothetical protein